MNCEKCQELMSELLDGTLPAERRAGMNAHLDGCFECASVREELSAIIGVAQDSRAVLSAPPNERALWLRIRNSIEAESAATAAATRAAGSVAPARESFWSRLAHRRLVFSLPQAATATAGVAVAVALVTVFGMRSLILERAPEQVQPARATARGFGHNPDVMMIDYLKQRVDERKVRWNPRMRQAYEQNMSVIDQTVNEMLQDLNRRPHDEVTEKALNAAMRDKIELLKEFSEL
ncbi:MAG TPA: anti-sigma factor [Pyrinomonadaceae bacterium]|nr:anti-sigma factor [Pyrinomonadaceae bacterium]